MVTDARGRAAFGLRRVGCLLAQSRTFAARARARCALVGSAVIPAIRVLPYGSRGPSAVAVAAGWVNTGACKCETLADDERESYECGTPQSRRSHRPRGVGKPGEDRSDRRRPDAHLERASPGRRPVRRRGGCPFVVTG